MMVTGKVRDVVVDDDSELTAMPGFTYNFDIQVQS